MTIQENSSAYGQIIKHVKAVGRARELLELAERRQTIFPGQGLPDHAWHLMLELLVHHYEGKQYTLEGICEASKMPFETCLRYINHLTNLGVIIRDDGELDSLARCVALSSDAHQNLLELLGDSTLHLV